MRNQTGLFLFLIIAMILFQSCIEIEYIIKVRNDSQADVNIRILLPNIGGDESSQVAADLESDGYDVTSYYEDDHLIIDAKKLMDLNDAILPFPENDQPGPGDFIACHDLFFLKFYTVKSQFILDDMDLADAYNFISRNPIPMRYKISFPGQIATGNTEHKEGEFHVWEYDLHENERVNIQMQSFEFYWERIIALIVIIFVVSLITRRRK